MFIIGWTASAAEQFHAILQQASQGEPSTVDSGLHRAQRYARERGNLAVVVAFDVEQDDGIALVGRDERQGLVERAGARSEEHTSELQSRENLVCRLLLEKKKKKEARCLLWNQKKRHGQS